MGTLLPLSLIFLAAQTPPVPVILDTDLGDDIDDTWALCMLLGSPEVDLRLVVTAFHDTDTKTRLVAKILEKTGHTEVPLGIGKKTKDAEINQAQWLGDYALDGYKGVVHKDGIQAMIDAIHASKEPITLCVIGPQTNIAEALKRDPSIAAKARVVSMAGSVYIGYNGKETPDPEWNVRADLEAARAVFAAPWEISYVPLDTCGTLVLKGERYQQVAGSACPLAAVTIDNYQHWKHRKNYPENQSSVLFDTLAACLTFAEDHVEMKTEKLRIDDKGFTVLDADKGRPVRCALTWKNRDAFEQLLADTLCGKRK